MIDCGIWYRFILNGDKGDEYDFMEGDSTASGVSTASTSSGTLKQAVKLSELGPRMRLKLLAVESGLYQGEYLYNTQTKEEMQDDVRQKQMEKKLQKKEVEEAKKEDEKLEAARKNEIETKREIDREREKRKQEKKERKEKKEAERKAKAKGKGKKWICL